MRAGAWAPAVLWAAVIFYLSSRSVVPEPAPVAAFPFHDKLEHMAEYGLLGALLVFALRRGPALVPPPPSWADRAAALAIAALYAGSDELHQAFVPLRQADPFDALADAVGALLLILVVARYLPPDRAGRADSSGPAPAAPPPPP